MAGHRGNGSGAGSGAAAGSPIAEPTCRAQEQPRGLTDDAEAVDVDRKADLAAREDLCSGKPVGRMLLGLWTPCMQSANAGSRQHCLEQSSPSPGAMKSTVPFSCDVLCVCRSHSSVLRPGRSRAGQGKGGRQRATGCSRLRHACSTMNAKGIQCPAQHQPTKVGQLGSEAAGIFRIRRQQDVVGGHVPVHQPPLLVQVLRGQEKEGRGWWVGQAASRRRGIRREQPLATQDVPEAPRRRPARCAGSTPAATERRRGWRGDGNTITRQTNEQTMLRYRTQAPRQLPLSYQTYQVWRL